MKRIGSLLALVWALLLGVTVTIPTPAQPAPIVRSGALPPGYVLRYQDTFHTWQRRQNSPSEEEGFLLGAGTWQFNTTTGKNSCIGAPGIGADYAVDPGLCNPGGGYPTDGQVSVDTARGELTMTLQPTPASLAASLPLSYGLFSGTCTITLTDMACTARTTNTLLAGATLTGTGVTAGTKVVSYGSNADSGPNYCTVTCHYTVSPSQSVASTTITSTGAWPMASAMLTSKEFLNFKPDKGGCYEVEALLPSAAGTVSVIWTLNTNAIYAATTDNYPAVAQAEIDSPEHFSASSKFAQSVAFHWNTSAGSTYFASSNTGQAPTNVEDGWHTYRACWTLTKIDFYVDGVAISTAPVPVAASSPGWGGQFQYLIIEYGCGNSSAAFFGVCDYTATTAMKVRRVSLYMPGEAVGCTQRAAGCDFVVNTKGDGLGLGRDIFTQSIQNPGYPNGQFQNGVTIAGTTTVDSIPGQPIKITVTGANQFDVMDYFLHAPVSGVISGHTYTILVKYAYVGSNPSGSVGIGIGHASAADDFYSVTGTTATRQGGSSCNSPSVTTVGSHKEFTCQWVAPATADGFFQVGPFSATNTQDVTLYSISFRDNATNPRRRKPNGRGPQGPGRRRRGRSGGPARDAQGHRGGDRGRELLHRGRGGQRPAAA